jgi:hypothetical protein
MSDERRNIAGHELNGLLNGTAQVKANSSSFDKINKMVKKLTVHHLLEYSLTKWLDEQGGDDFHKYFCLHSARRILEFERLYKVSKPDAYKDKAEHDQRESSILKKIDEIDDQLVNHPWVTCRQLEESYRQLKENDALGDSNKTKINETDDHLVNHALGDAKPQQEESDGTELATESTAKTSENNGTDNPEGSTNIEPISTKIVQVSNNDCKYSGLLKVPKKADDWFFVIDDMVIDFFMKHEKPPNETQAWGQLWTSPPAGYSITTSTEKGKAGCLNMPDVRPLSKRAFIKRWKKYTDNAQ